jgi:hypothetical protein
MSSSPLPCSYTAIYYAYSGTPSSYSNTAMQEVDLSSVANGEHARYTVYRITSAALRGMFDSTVPVFEKDVAGNGAFATLTPSEIWYGVGYIVLSVAIGATDVVRCASGSYIASTQLIGAFNRTYTDKTNMEDKTEYGDQSIMRHPVVDEWDAKVDVFWAKGRSNLRYIGGAANSYFNLVHMDGGINGNTYSLTMTNPGGNGALSVALNTKDVTVTLGVSGGVITSTAAEVVAAINAVAAIRAAHLQAFLEGSGSGLVAALSHQHLNETTAGATGTAGAELIDLGTLKGVRMIVQFYDNYSTKYMNGGIGYISDVAWSGDPKSLAKASMTLVSGSYRLYGVVNN